MDKKENGLYNHLMRNDKTTVVFGAGADCGIFPMTNHLIAAINRFLKHDETGIQAEHMLRKALGLKHYCYGSIMDEVAFRFIRKPDSGQIENIRRSIASLSPTLSEKKLCDFILAMIDEIKNFPKKNRDNDRIETHPDLLKLLNATGLNKIVTVCPETSVNSFLLKVFRALLHVYLDQPENKVLHQLFKTIVRFDAILLELFLGFYNGNQSDIRRYMYVSWTMWAFFVHTEQLYLLKFIENPCIYMKIKECSAITLNYTTLADRFMGKNTGILHFHGSSINYIDCGTREEITLPSFAGGNSVEEFPPMLEILKNDVLPLLHPDWNHSIIPSMIPPFEIKPIIASGTIETWHKALNVLSESNKIVVIGYSFNHVDMHFNDSIIKWVGCEEKTIFIINPDIKSIVSYFESCPKRDLFNDTPWQTLFIEGTDINCMKKSNVIIIPGTTKDILGENGRYIDVKKLSLC